MRAFDNHTIQLLTQAKILYGSQGNYGVTQCFNPTSPTFEPIHHGENADNFSALSLNRFNGLAS